MTTDAIRRPPPSAGPCATLALLLTLAAAPAAVAQPPGANYDEAKVGLYTLPDPLVGTDGERVTSAEAWVSHRRPELIRLFETYVYGRVPSPARPIVPSYRVTSEEPRALGGKATRREVTVSFSGDPSGPYMDLLIYLPNSSKGRKAPAFLGLNFEGNHAVTDEPGVALCRSWLRDRPDGGVKDHRATESARGSEASRWQVGRVIDRGYALVTACYNDLDPDFDDGFRNGVHPLFYRPGQSRPDPDQWGAIGVWAWGLSQALDYLETLPEVDAGRVAVVGHSRLGKTALWAGARDARFAAVISNNSGAGGAALSRRIYGETVERLNTSFPHWFCANHRMFNGREDLLPVDQHELIALIAPRPVLVSSAEEDRWADPKGEYLAARGADPVYRLLGTDGLAGAAFPPPSADSLVGGTIAYRLRPGKHDVTADDWEAFLRFADRHFKVAR